MFDIDFWQELWHTITANKKRSVLTAFGVTWGMVMLIVMAGCGFGLKKSLNEQFESVDANASILFSNFTTEAYDGYKAGRWWQLTDDDLELLRSQYPEITRITGEISQGGGLGNNVVRNGQGGAYSLRGIEPVFQSILSTKMLSGRYINNIDIDQSRKVCVIGRKIVNALYMPGEDPIGTTIQVNGIGFTVVGTCTDASESVNIGSQDDETVILPISTMRLMFGSNNTTLDMIVFATDGKAPIAPLTERIRQTLYSAHHISPTDKGAMWVMSMQDILNKTNALFGGLTILIWLVGIGTLFAGAVGVSNIMLVTVRERRQEIGIRRALGASPRVIIRQILCESFVLTSLAGVVGIVLGVWLLRLIASIITASSDSGFVLNPQISFGLTMVALVILIVLGIAAGLLPAQKAISVKAVEALQEE